MIQYRKNSDELIKVTTGKRQYKQAHIKNKKRRRRKNQLKLDISWENIINDIVY